MRVLITGGDGRLARAATAALAPAHTLRVADRRFTAPLPAGVEGCEGDPRDEAFAAAIVEGVDAALHLAPLDTGGDDLDLLDRATRGTYQLAGAAARAGVGRLILGSTLALFDTLPRDWRPTEAWRPRPRPEPATLRAWLAERSLREVARESGLPAVCLRFGRIVDDAATAAASHDPRALHLADALAGIERALAYGAEGWSVFHIVAAGERAWPPLAGAADEPFGYRPARDFGERPAGATAADPAPPPIPSRPIRKVVVFGAGGPLAAATARVLAPDYTLRLTDLRPLEEIAAAGQPQSPGAPLPELLPPPHERRTVDVRDPAAVLDACAGMDAIVNCTVVRHDTTEAFRVNLLGAENVLRAAVAHGIRRVVHTGPYQLGQRGAAGYDWDDEVPDDAPPRPGAHRYFHTKYLAQELCRAYAEYYGLEVPTLLFCNFVNPAVSRDNPLYPFTVSWEDAARALRRALEVAALPAPYEVFHINADLPHGVFPNRKAWALLGWQPRDSLARYYRRPMEE